MVTRRAQGCRAAAPSASQYFLFQLIRKTPVGSLFLRFVLHCYSSWKIQHFPLWLSVHHFSSSIFRLFSEELTSSFYLEACRMIQGDGGERSRVAVGGQDFESRGQVQETPRPQKGSTEAVCHQKKPLRLGQQAWSGERVLQIIKSVCKVVVVLSSATFFLCTVRYIEAIA